MGPGLLLAVLAAGACDSGIPPDLGELGLTRPVQRTMGVAYGDDPEQRLDLYLQSADLDEGVRRPVFLFFHGGGWIDRPTEPDGRHFGMPFLNRGWQVVSATYRLGPNTAPLAVDDALCALRWVYDSADEYGFDTDSVVVAGFSAGGHLSLTAAILSTRPGHRCSLDEEMAPVAGINWGGITNIETVQAYLAGRPQSDNYALKWAGDLERIPALSEQYSPILIVDGDAPLLLSVQGEQDLAVPYTQATSFHARLDSLGVPNHLFLRADEGHLILPGAHADPIADSILLLLGGR